MDNLLITGIFLVLGLSQVSMMLYYWFFNREIKEIGTNELKISGPLAEQNGEHGWNIIHGAIKQSQAIVGEAELAGAKLIAANRLRSDRLEQKAEEQIGLTAEEVQKTLLAETAKASKNFQEGLTAELAELASIRVESEQIIGKRSEELMAQFGKDLSDKLALIETKSITAAEAEVEIMKKVVADYQKKRIEQIDEQSVTMVEQVVRMLIKTDFNAEAHSEAIKQSIEEAKKAQFFD